MQKPVEIILIHPEIQAVSDRSARELLKALSKTVRRAHLQEILNILRSAECSDVEIQSALDRLKNIEGDIPTYYVRRIEKGSLEALFFVGAGYVGKFLQEVFVDLALEEIKESNVLKAVKRYFKNNRSALFADILQEQVREYFRVGRFEVEDVYVRETKRRVLVHIALDTIEEFGQISSPEYDDEKILELIETLKRRNKTRRRPMKG